MIDYPKKENHSGASPTVSIVVPFYNAQDTLGRCLESLTNQTYGAFEVILINDGSIDNGSIVANKYIEADARIKMISQDNTGQAAARNVGILNSMCDYVCFVDADDYVHPLFLERLMGAIGEDKNAVAVCNFMKVVGSTKTPEFDTSRDVSFSTLEALAELNYHRRFDSSAGGKVFPRQFFNEIHFPVGMKCEDAAIMHLLIAQCTRLIYVSEPLYFYTRSIGSTTRTRAISKTFVEDALRAIEVRRAFYEEHFPGLMQSMNTESLLSIIYSYGRYSINGGDFPKGELKKMLNRARSYLGSSLTDRNVPLSRKTQSVLFCVSPKMYTKCYALLSSRRGY